jgi:HK97 gp10 family phage protein
MATSYNRLPEIIARLQPEVDRAVQEAAKSVVDSAKARVPVNTGRLRDAIHVQVELEGVYVVAGNREAWYGHIVEHGSVKQPPHPFLLPALEENRAEIVAAVELAVRKAVR